MKRFKQSILVVCGLLLLLIRQSVWADDRPHGYREPHDKHWQTRPAPRNPSVEHRFDRHRETRPLPPPPTPTYRQYYKPGYHIDPLPYGYNRLLVDAIEYFFFDGYFYRPSRGGYVIVDAPIGAVVAVLPRLHRVIYRHGRPYYIVGNTFYRKHSKGYIVVPDPGAEFRRR
ncbi:MAG: DUF6515 family protein [Gammaproteobacteria bacterium]